MPSDAQHPNKLLLHNGSGHPLNFLPVAAETPSSQHPNLVSLHVSGTAHPSSNGPVAAVLLSAQQPNLLLRQADGFCGLGLHLRGVCSFVTIASNVFGVDPHRSSSSVVSDDELDELICETHYLRFFPENVNKSNPSSPKFTGTFAFSRRFGC